MALTGKFTKALSPLFESMSICPVRAIRFMTSIPPHFRLSDCSGQLKFRLLGSTCNLEKAVRPSKHPM